MNAEIFAEWMRLQGFRVVRIADSYWFNQGPRAFQAFPYHHLINPDRRELANLLIKKKALCLRFSTSVDSQSGATSYHVIYDGPDYDIEMLDRRTRQNIRKGLSNCCIEQISLKRLADEGFDLEVDTADRQCRNLCIARNAWRKKFLCAERLPGFEAWGALANGCLGATLLTFQLEDCCYMIYAQSDRRCLPLRVNNALSYIVTKTMVERTTINSVFYGLQSLDATPGVDEFKLRMGYRAKPVLQCVEFHPWLSVFLNRYSHHALKYLVAKYPRKCFLSKAEGMLRLHLDGKRPAERLYASEIAGEVSHNPLENKPA